jgi:hypothetical protein
MSRFILIAFLVAAPFHADAQPDSPLMQGFVQSELTPGASIKLALGLLYDQATVAVPEWGSDRGGLERRAEWLVAGWAARASVEYVVASRRGVDTGYRPCACKGFPRRAAHALREGFREYRAGGTPVPALARFSGLAAGSLATIPMLPAGYGLRDAAGRAVTAFGIDEGFNLLHEFRKEIVRTLLWRRPWQTEPRP